QVGVDMSRSRWAVSSLLVVTLAGCLLPEPRIVGTKAGDQQHDDGASPSAAQSAGTPPQPEAGAQGAAERRGGAGEAGGAGGMKAGGADRPANQAGAAGSGGRVSAGSGGRVSAGSGGADIPKGAAGSSNAGGHGGSAQSSGSGGGSVPPSRQLPAECQTS